MCGIVGFVGKKNNKLKILLDGLINLEYRGYDSAGIAFVKDNKVITIKEKGKLANLINSVKSSSTSNIGIGHTRWATHGEANEINAHPHTVGKITLVHNGIIENYLEIKQELVSYGYTFNSTTDTEIGAALIDYYYKNTNDIIKSIRLFKEKVIGSYAILLICHDELDKLYVLKKASPIIIGLGDNINYVASDILAISKYTNKYYNLEDDEYAIITNKEITIYNKDNQITNKDIIMVTDNHDIASKGEYEHYMLKEINEEIEVIKRMINIDKYPIINKYQNIVIVGCGSAMHAGMVGAFLIEKYLNIPVKVEIASEFRYKKLFIDAKTLVIAISQSGETADTLEAVKIAKQHHSHTLGIINVKNSSIAREVDEVIYTLAGPEIAVATTKGYLSQVLVFAMLIGNYLNDNNYKEELHKLPDVIKDTINRQDEYMEIAKKIYKAPNMFYIGRGIDYAISMEGSLKIKEISYLHSEAYPAGELKHGTISLIEKGLPVFGIVTDRNIAIKTISNLKEVKARDGFVILITTELLDTNGDFYDYKLVLPSTNELLSPIVTIIPLQLIAYYVAKLNNCDIDKPKNLAKSVTVE